MALLVPPVITEGDRFAKNVPAYADDVTEFVQDNPRLRELNRDYDITTKLQEEAEKLPDKLGGAAGTLRDVGIGIVNSLFALVTILVLTAFLLANGRTWTDRILATGRRRNGSDCGAHWTTWPGPWAATWPGRSPSR